MCDHPVITTSGTRCGPGLLSGADPSGDGSVVEDLV